MSKQLKFSGSVAIPDSASQAAKLVGAVSEHKSTFEQALSNIFGQTFVLEDRITNERGKKAKSEAEPEAAA